MPKDKEKERDRDREERKEKERDKIQRKKAAYTLDVTPDDYPKPTKMEEDPVEFSGMKSLMTDDNGRAFKELKADPNYEPPRSVIRLDPEPKTTTTTITAQIEHRTLKPYVSVDFDTQYPLSPFAMIVALDEGHAFMLMDQELKRMGRKTSAERPYTVRELHLSEPSAFIVSMGQMPDS